MCPQIPTYTSREQLGTQVAKPEAQASNVMVDASSYGRGGAMLQAAGETLGGITEKLEQLRDLQQTTEAENLLLQQSQVIQENTAKDPDIWNADKKAQEELRKAGEQAANKISNNFTRMKFQDAWNSSSAVTMAKIKAGLNQRRIQKTENDINEYIKNKQTAFVTSISTVEKENILNEIKTKLETLSQYGAISPETKEETFNKTRNELFEAQLDWDVSTNPIFAQAELRKDGGGIYKDIAVKERIKTQDKATKLVAKQEAELKLLRAQAMNQRENELITLQIKKQLSTKMIEDDLGAEKISPKFAGGMIDSLLSSKAVNAKPTTLQSIIKYNELVERNINIARQEKAWFGISKVPFEEITKFRADTINANAGGFITDKQMTDLLSETSKTFYRDHVFQNALEQLSAQSELYDTSEAQARVKAEMYGNLITKVIEGKNPRDAVTEVIKERLNTELEEIVKTENQTNRQYAKKGNQRIYSDDGIIWYDEKTNEVV